MGLYLEPRFFGQLILDELNARIYCRVEKIPGVTRNFDSEN